MPEVLTEEYTLRYLGDPVLKEVCSFVDTSFSVDPKLIEVMKETVEKYRAAGLAANQVGSTKRICLVSVSGGVLTMINPVITSKSPIMDQRSEGCLSIPQFYTYITRPRRVVVEYLTENFFRRVVLLEEVEAQAVQHEIDHLEGKLITDHVSRTQYRKAEALVKEHLNGRRS